MGTGAVACRRELFLLHSLLIFLWLVCTHAQRRFQQGPVASSLQRLQLAQAQGQDLCSQNTPGIPLNWRPNDKVLALTFDDGPHAQGVNGLLDVLKAERVPGTFFVNTYTVSGWLGPFNSQPNQAAMKRLLSEGHELGSHAAEHLRLSELPPNETAQQITWAIGNISAVTGSTTVPLFRAPYGDGFMGVASPPPTTVQQLWSTVRQQHVHIAWTFSGDDFKIGGSDLGCAARLFDAYGPPLVQRRVTGVVLMHSTPNGIGGCPQALQRLISYYKAAGYKFVTVSTLVEQIYGMSPARVVQAVQACSRAGQRTAQSSAGPFRTP